MLAHEARSLELAGRDRRGTLKAVRIPVPASPYMTGSRAQK